MRVPLPTLLALVFFIVARSGEAGERLTVDQLVRRAKAIATVEVSLDRGEVKLTKMMIGDKAALAPADKWLSFCLPDKAMLKRWQQTHAHLKSAPLWQKALDAGRYSAVVFFAGDEKTGLLPTCETEGMLAESWSVNPNRPAFVNALLVALKTQARARARAAPAPEVKTEPKTIAAPPPPKAPPPASKGCF